jgi:sigma-70-like protein
MTIPPYLELLVVDDWETANRREHHAALHEEINRLPRRDRTVFVLCDLEGQALVEVANQFQWPVAKLMRGLARARRRLQHRMSRRGYTIPVRRLAADFSPGAAGELPWGLIDSTIVLAIRDRRWSAAASLGMCACASPAWSGSGPFGEGLNLMDGARSRGGKRASEAGGATGRGQARWG